MSRFNIFLIRAILGTVFAVVLLRFFYQKTNLVYTAALGIFLVGMAYFLDYLRKRKK